METNSKSVIEHLNQTIDFIQQKTSNLDAKIAVILGSGLSGFTQQFEIMKEFDYKDLPHFPVSTVHGHLGKLILAKMGNVQIWLLAGRFHYYEGYTPAEVVYPIRILKLLGVKTILLTNAAGGVNRSYIPGDLMLIKDHISIFVPNPLIGPNLAAFGERFPDMSNCYDKNYRKQVKEIAEKLHIKLHEGVYCGLTGPTFETKAEYKLLLHIGADACGMSTVQEAIVAVHSGIKLIGISIITNVGQIEETEIINDHQEVLDVANMAKDKLSVLFKELIHQLFNE
ncbi:MAG: purine-nucleoside phosphorylase [Sediminibacterium sp.]|nr:purine-nucleoside phosphorylase [Sediminibacterium sp.]